MSVKNMTKKQIQTFFERLRTQRPHPQTELNYSSPFELLIAVLLSAQATDVSVNKATDKLYAVANTAQAILNLGVDGLQLGQQSLDLVRSQGIAALKVHQSGHHGGGAFGHVGACSHQEKREF